MELTDDQLKFLKSALLAREIQPEEVQSALARMADGSYGDCLKCEEPIHWGRLKTKPESTLCLSCQQQSDRE